LSGAFHAPLNGELLRQLAVKPKMKWKYPMGQGTRMKRHSPPVLLLLAILALLILHGCYRSPHLSTGEAEPVERRVNEFIGSGLEFLGNTIILSMDAVISKFGKPVNLTSRKVKNRHDDVLDTIYELFYEGLYFEIYEVSSFERSYVYHIILANKKYQSKWRLGIGATKEYVTATLGRPDKSEKDSWTYMASGYPNSVRFTFEKDTVHEIEWIYALD
jgi:hypothetical protein